MSTMDGDWQHGGDNSKIIDWFNSSIDWFYLWVGKYFSTHGGEQKGWMDKWLQLYKDE